MSKKVSYLDTIVSTPNHGAAPGVHHEADHKVVLGQGIGIVTEVVAQSGADATTAVVVDVVEGLQTQGLLGGRVGLAGPALDRAGRGALGPQAVVAVAAHAGVESYTTTTTKKKGMLLSREKRKDAYLT